MPTHLKQKKVSRLQDKPWRGPPGLYAVARELRPLFYLFVLFFKKSRFFYFVFLFACCVMVSFGDRFLHVFCLSAFFPSVIATIGIRNFNIFSCRSTLILINMVKRPILTLWWRTLMIRASISPLGECRRRGSLPSHTQFEATVRKTPATMAEK